MFNPILRNNECAVKHGAGIFNLGIFMAVKIVLKVFFQTRDNISLKV